MSKSLQQSVRIGICVAVFALFFGMAFDADAAITRQAASGPWTGVKTTYTTYPDLQFYSPTPPGSYNSTYNYGCQQDSSNNLECHKMFPTEDVFDTYDCGNSGTSPSNLANLGSAWLFNNCVFVGDTTAPAPPPVVTLTAVSASQVNVSWTPSLDSGSGMAFYRVYRFQGPCCTPIDLPTIDVLAPQTTYAHTSLSANTWYGYYVIAYDLAGNYSSSSGLTYIQTPVDSTPPAPAPVLSGSAVSSSQINLSWTASNDPETGVVSYRVYRDGAPIATVSNATLSYSNTGLAVSTTYSYRVEAVNGIGLSVSSIPLSLSTSAPLDVTPPIFSAAALSGTIVSSTQIDLSWLAATDNVAVVAYDVYRNGTFITTLSASTLSYSDMGLTPSTAYSYYVRARDAAGNPTNSNTINLNTPPPPDITPPTFTFTSPAMTLPSGTTSALLAGTTMTGLNPEQAICRFSSTSGTTPFDSMSSFAQIILSPNHSQTISGLTDGIVYTYHVKCRDAAGNESLVLSHMFQVASPAPDMTPPVIFGGAPTGVLGAGTTSATMSVATDENAYCRYNQGSDIAYSAMTNAFSVTGTTIHTVPLTGLVNGTSYVYFVRCQDTPGGNENTAGYAITFSIANPVNVNPVALIAVLPGTSGVAPFAVSADGSGSYDMDGTIVQYIWTWGDGTPDTVGTATASHAYTGAGTYTMTLRVIDNQGGSGTTTQAITVAPPMSVPPPPPVVAFCIAACTTDADCAVPNVCSASGVCVAPGSIGGGPLRSNGYLSLLSGAMSQPTPAVFPSTTKSVVMSVETDVNAECQYTTFVDTPYGGSAMQTFASTGATKHAITLTGITGTLTTTTATTPKTYDYYVRCKDAATGDVNTSDYPISFTITGATVISGPDDYTCLINKNFVRNNIPYIFDVCIPK